MLVYINAFAFSQCRMWGTLLADVVIQMLGTDYARIVRAIYAFAQVQIFICTDQELPYQVLYQLSCHLLGLLVETGYKKYMKHQLKPVRQSEKLIVTNIGIWHVIAMLNDSLVWMKF